MSVKNIVSVSGGFGSFATLLWVHQQGLTYHAVFADTVVEHPDLYRFLVEGLYAVKDLEISETLRAKISKIPPLQQIEARKQHLKLLGKYLNLNLPGFTYLTSDETIFDVFRRKKFMGSDRFDPCSQILKRQKLSKFVESFNCPVNHYIGIGDEERHRFDRMQSTLNNTWKAPLIENPEFVGEAKEFLISKGVELPILYSQGFSHNNCSGFCVKSGQKQATLLHQHYPENYEWFAKQEESVYTLMKPKQRVHAPFIRKTEKGVTNRFTLREYRDLFILPGVEPELDAMGCGCFLTDDGSLN